MSDFCELFKHNPSINPYTGRPIKINGPIYRQLVAMCGLPYTTSALPPLVLPPLVLPRVTLLPPPLVLPPRITLPPIHAPLSPPPLVLNHKIMGCGTIRHDTIGYDNSWRQFNANREICKQNITISRTLEHSFINAITEATDKGQNVIILLSTSDAVKNMHLDDQAASEKAYDVLPPNFATLTYEEKANLMRTMPPTIDYKLWSRQQWPYNTFRYSELVGAKCIYIQSDLNYCTYPSMFAEAMCGTLYTESERIDDLHYHFRGPQHDLYCVGQHTIGYGLINSARKLNNPQVIFLPDELQNLNIKNNIEWLRMSDEFLITCYNYMITYGKVPYYIMYPWEAIYPVKNLDAMPTTVNISSFHTAISYQNITYIKDIPYDGMTYQYGFMVHGIYGKVLSTWEMFPLSPILGHTGTISKLLLISTGPIIFIKQTYALDGTLYRPRVVFDDGRTIEYSDIAKYIIPVLQSQIS